MKHNSDRKLFCNDWEFYKAAFGSDYSEDFAFKPVDIPHDWLIYDTNDLYETSTGWYRKNFSYQKEEGIRTFIRFDGVYMDSKVYVNGALAGEWKYGYSAFMFDITDLVKNGENIITVRVDHHSPNSRWYSGAGIFRKVWLCESPEIRFGNDGIYITTSKQEDGWQVTVKAEMLRPVGTPLGGIRIRNTIFDKDGKEVASYESEGIKTAELYDRTKLDEPDAYEVFLGGDYDKIDIRTTADSTDRLLLVKDSFADCMIPFLIPYYREIIVVDADYYQKHVSDLLDKNKNYKCAVFVRLQSFCTG